MALTQEEIERMDRITEFKTVPVEQKKIDKNATLTEDDFKNMDRIVGIKPQQYQIEDNLKEEIKRENPDEVKIWESKGAISPFSAAQNAAREFSGTYNNIDENANLNWFENWLKNSEWSKRRSATVQERIEKNKAKQQETDERINGGTASIWDKIGKGFEDAGQEYIKGRIEKSELNEVIQGVNRQDKTKKYEVANVTKDGLPIYREIDLMKKIGFIEGIQRRLAPNIPIIGTWVEGKDKDKFREIKDKIIKGKPIRQDELNFINNTIARKKEEYVRGYSIGGILGTGTTDSLGLAGDILVGSYLGSALGLGAIASSTAAKAKRLSGLAEWGINAFGGAGLTVLSNPQRLYAQYQERMLGNEMKLTDRGTVIFQESEEKPTTAFFKSMLGTYIMYFTEVGGGQALSAVTNGAIKGISGAGGTVVNKLIQKNPALGKFLENTTKELSKRYEQMQGLPVVGKSVGWLKDKAHFDGFLEEMGEEALEDVLNLTFGVNNEERSLENYANAVFKSPEEWAIIAGTILIQGVGLSAVSYVIGNKMAEKGAPKEEIEEVLNNTTEAQKINIMENLLKSKDIDIEDAAKVKSENVVNGLAQNFIENKTFANKKEAESAANVFVTALEKISDVTGASIEDLIKEEIPEIKREAELVAKENGINIAIQKAMDKRMNDLNELPDNFDDEAYIQEIIDDIEILEKMDNGTLTQEDYARANKVIEKLGLNELQQYQQIDDAGIRNIEENFGNTIENITGNISDNIKNLLENYNVNEDEFKFEDIRIYGYYSTGRNNENSDIDVLVQYSGFMREDDAFKMFHDEGLVLVDKDGREVEIDINPINVEQSGTIDEKLGQMSDYQKRYFQTGNVVDLTNEFEKVPTFEDVRKHLFEILDSGVSFETKTEGYRIDIKQTDVQRNDRKPTNVVNKLTKKGNPKRLNKSAIGRNNKYLKTIERLIINSELKRNEEKNTDGYDNNKKKEKPHVRQYYNFDVPVCIGEIIYTVRLQAEEWKNDKKRNGIKTVHLYNIYETKKSPRLDPMDKTPIKTAREDINNVNQNKGNVNDNERYFQSPGTSKLNKLQRKDGKYVDIEYYDNSDVKNVKPLNIRELKYENKDIKDITKAKLKKDILDNKKSIKIKNSKSGINAALKASSIDEMFADIFKDKGYEYLRKEIISNIETIFENAIPILKHPELKNKNLYNTQIIHRFGLPVKIGGNNFLTMLTVKERTDSKERQIDEFAIYNLTSKNERELDSSSQGADAATSRNQTLNYSINGLTDFIKGNIKKYAKSEQSKKYTQDVDDKDALLVFKSGVSMYYDADQRSIFEGNNIAHDGIRELAKKNIKGSYIPAKNLIELLKNADASTVIHEFAHWWLTRLEKYANKNEELAQDLQAVRDFVKNNGEEFTQGQHEKFAAGFEAYVRSGYAKNNRLKKIFEDFKNFLLAIYDSIKNIVWIDDNGQEQHYTEEDIPGLNELFSRLLTSERERIKTTVFDKIAEIDSKIQHIISNEKNELKELDELWKADKENLKYLNRKSDKKRKVEEYLELAEKMTSRETKEMKEFKKRYKDVTLDILSVATGYDKRFIANPRNLEKVQMALEKTEDRITLSGGMRGEWEEFYSDTGVNYDTDEVGGGYKLASQAFNVLAEGRYEKTLSDNYEFEDIGKFAAKFDYLQAKVKSLKGEEKQAALEALFKLFEAKNIPAMPDDVFSDLSHKLTEAAKEYEEEQKNDFNSKYIASIPIISQLQSFITRKLTDLKVYNPETRYKMRINKSHRLYRYIKDINSVNTAKRQVELINEFVIEDMMNNQRSILHKEIQKQIRINSKVVKTGTMRKGKFDWRTNTIFHILEELNRKPHEEILKEYEYLTGIDKCEEDEAREKITEQNVRTLKETSSRQDLLYREFLEYRAKRISELDVGHTIRLLQDILELKEKGRAAKSEEEFNKVFEREDLKQGLVDKMREKLQDKEVQKYIAKWVAGETLFTSERTLANWETLLTVIFGKDVARENSLLYLEAQAEVYAHNKTVEFLDIIRDCYNLARKNETAKDKIKNTFDRIIDYDLAQDIARLFKDYDEEITTVSHRTWNKDTNEVLISKIELSRSEIMTFYGWARNDAYKERLVNAFGEEQLEEMFSMLSKQDKVFMERASKFCDTMFDATNEVFIRTTGLSLPKVQNYLPGRTERYGSDLDLYSERVVKCNDASFTKYRKKCSKIEMKPTTPLALILPHINKTARYVVMSERVNFLNRVFCNNKHLQDALNDIYSKNAPMPDVTFRYDYVHNAVTGAKVPLELNENIYAGRLAPKVVDIKSLPFEISDKPSENRKNIIEALGLKDNEREIENGNTFENVKFNEKTIEKSMSNIKRGSLNYVDFCKIMLDAEYLFKTSQKMLSHENIKGDTPLIIDRYANIAHVDNNEYLLEFIVKNKEEVSLYSLNPTKEILSTKRLTDDDDYYSSTLDSINYSIIYIQDILKGRLVEKYNRDYLKAKNEARENARKARKKSILSKIPVIKNIGKIKKETTGTRIMNVLRNQLAASTYDSYARDYQMSSDIWDNFISNWVAASIGGNAKVMLTQLVSVINYSEDMPIEEWNKRFKDNLLQPKKTIKYMMDNCDYLKARLAGNSQNEVIQRLANDASMFTSIRKFMTANTKYGDILAIIFGGKPYVDYLIEIKGLTKEEAFKRFIEATLRSQQSGHNSATSAWQKDAGRNKMARIVLGAFNNTNLQYERKWVEAISNYTSGDITKKQFIKEMLIYKFINPVLFTSVFTNLALSAFIVGLFGGDDPKELAKNLGIDLGFAVLLSNLKGYGCAGIATLAAAGRIRYFMDGSKTFMTSLGPISELEDAISKIGKEGMTVSDYIMDVLAPPLQMTGIPTARLLNLGKSIYDISKGDIGTGIYEGIGYSNYRATYGATGKAPDYR